MKLISYLRVSTSEQASSGLGLEAQRQDIAAWAEVEGHIVVGEYVDAGLSGTLPVDARPALLDALNALSRGYGLIISKWDRVARNMQMQFVVEYMAERVGAVLVCAEGENDDSPDAALMKHIKAAFAQYEVARTRARTRAAIAVRKKQGKRTGQIPYGYHVDLDGETLRKLHGEQCVIDYVRAWSAMGHSQRAIVARLNEDVNLRKLARGKRWHKTTVARILRA